MDEKTASYTRLMHEENAENVGRDAPGAPSSSKFLQICGVPRVSRPTKRSIGECSFHASAVGSYIVEAL